MEQTEKETRIRKITSLYYSRKDIQNAIFEFSKNREVCPRYFEGFGKRPDSFQYPGDIFELVKKGATSFHCSEEIWRDPLGIATGMNEKLLNDLREGWDLLIDIDCKWIDYSKLAAESIIKVLKNNGIKGIGLKFSGSKGFHIIVPWKSFPKEINGIPTKDLFPEIPRKIVSYIRFMAEKEMKDYLPEDFYSQFKDIKIKKGIKCNTCSEIAIEKYKLKYICRGCGREEQKNLQEIPKIMKCPECNTQFDLTENTKFYSCQKCKLDSISNPNDFSRSIEVDLFELMGLDLILVSPRHLFRMPYSLHEKTALASIVIDTEKIRDFDMKDAEPMGLKVINFIPDSIEGEAKDLVREALDWHGEDKSEQLSKQKESFEPIKIENLSDKFFPPSIKKILEGVGDGRKRALFILINFFRSVGLEKAEMEKIIYGWNEKNEIPLKEGYIKTQIIWAYRNKIILPPNYDKDYYKGIGVIPTNEELKFKNPVNFTKFLISGDTKKQSKTKKKKKS